jgi:hypothetical protein
MIGCASLPTGRAQLGPYHRNDREHIGQMTAAGRLSPFALTLLMLAAFATQTRASGLLAPAEQSRLVAQLDKRPMVFFVAKGPADSCGRGCGEWIAAEGKFVPGTAQRFRDFLGTLSRRDLPIFFHSLGGSVADAAKVGVALRERGMTAGVGRTIAEQCRVFAREDPCQRLIASGGEIKARLRSSEGQCHSACVVAFVGASNRRVPGGAIMSVHSARLDARLAQQAGQQPPSAGDTTVAAVHQRLEHYLTLMGIDPRLQQTAAKVTSRRIYVLSRDEIARFGIDTGGFYETPWASFTDPSKRPFVLKSATRTMDPDRSEHRTVGVHFRCLLGQTWLVYQRELPSNEIGYAALVRIVAGESDLVLRRGPKKETSEMWLMPAASRFLRNAVAAPSMVFTEDVIPSGNSQIWSRETKLSTAGLSNAIDGVVKSCDGARLPEATRSDGKR